LVLPFYLYLYLIIKGARVSWFGSSVSSVIVRFVYLPRPSLRLKRDPITLVSQPSRVLIEYILRIVQALGRVTYKQAGSRTRIEEHTKPIIMDVVVASKGPALPVFTRPPNNAPACLHPRRLGHLAGLLTVARP
jgi:hypothetical protein